MPEIYVDEALIEVIQPTEQRPSIEEQILSELQWQTQLLEIQGGESK
ncbi:hypothetical protein [Lysinibacillus sp. 54212]